MRATLILAMFTASLAHADWGDYQEERDLSLDASSIAKLEISAGAGSMLVEGVSGSDVINVRAIIQVPDEDEEDAQQIIEKDMILTLEAKDDTAILKGYFDHNGWGNSPSMRLEVQLPERLALEIDDSSGSIRVNDVHGDIEIDDSSGSIKMEQVGGNIQIEDGSGSITVDGAGGDVTIEDGSGSVKVTDVQGSVTVDDGSGSITVRNVAQDLIILDDGSGSVNYYDVQGRVELDD